MAYSDDPDHELSTIEWEQYMEETGRWYEGDPRRCPHHPHVVTSSPDGMFDAPCGECEYAMYEDAQAIDAARDANRQTDLDQDRYREWLERQQTPVDEYGDIDF